MSDKKVFLYGRVSTDTQQTGLESQVRALRKYCISQLERELIAERVRNGLANARAKGIHIGRKKTRPSELIRALLLQKMKYREIAKIANCSHGAINSERKEMLKEVKQVEEVKQEKPSLSLV